MVVIKYTIEICDGLKWLKCLFTQFCEIIRFNIFLYNEYNLIPDQLLYGKAAVDQIVNTFEL